MERKTAFELLAALALLVLALAGPANAQYAGGSGTPDDPYLIATPEQLNAIGADPNDWDKHFRLTADIDLSQYTGIEFNIIGREVTIETYQPGSRGAERLVLAEALIPFTGTFDGDGHTISNFTYLGWEVDRVGLFGYVADPDARITNLELRAPHIYVENADAVGALIGRFEDGAIVNCHVREAVVLLKGVLRAGTLAGVVDGGAVTACSSDRGMVLDDYESHRSGSQVGGLIGRLGRAVLTNCFVDGGLALGIGSIGGLIGNKEGGAIENCWAAATVTGEERVGGLVGRTWGSVTGCYATGDVQGTDVVGGLAGMNGSAMMACYAAGPVSGQEAVGGLAGENEGQIAHCYATGSVDGEDEVGGVVGRSKDKDDIILCFWDIDTSGVAESDGGTGLTTGEMMTAAPFLGAGWDFVGEAENGTDDLWWIDEGVDYPRLWWEDVGIDY